MADPMHRFSQRHYEVLARAFKLLRLTASDFHMRTWFDLCVLDGIADVLKQDNPKFNKQKFLIACDFAVPPKES